jgi:hypothetical protein
VSQISNLQRGIELLIPHGLNCVVAEHESIYFWPKVDGSWVTEDEEDCSLPKELCDALQAMSGWEWDEDLNTWTFMT